MTSRVLDRRRFLLLAAATSLELGCGERPSMRGHQPAQGPGSDTAPDALPAASPSYAAVLIEDVPHVRQRPDFCGEAVTASWLAKLGQPLDQDQVFSISRMDPARGMGVTTRELTDALVSLGFDPGPVWHRVEAARSSAELEALFAQLHADLLRGVPSIVCTRFDAEPRSTEHFRLILGYDPARDEIIYHDPALDSGAYLRMRRSELLSLWPLKYQPQLWTVIRLRLERTSAVSVPAVPEGFSPADYARHVMKIRGDVPKDFHVLIEPPFVVVGDGSAQRLRQRAEHTIRWAVDRLQRAYFPKQPSKILTVWLFDGKLSYEKYHQALWNEIPDTPYGYYSPSREALVMNIATGGGTLVHEIVHPFVEANFPNAPAWLNEGLGSLYEQSADRDGEIVGLTNWRLPGLQQAIRANRVRSFEWLTHTSDRAFYTDDSGLHYAQARYLMYYLQEHGLLHSFYHKALANRRADPSGYQALLAVLGKPDMKRFEARWQRWVLQLRFG